MSATCKIYDIDEAPGKIELFGIKSKERESATHVIEFPGGAVEVSRTSDGNYWAHIIVNNDYIVEGCNGIRKSYGVIISSRVDTGNGVNKIPSHEDITQVALLIKPICRQGGINRC